MACKLRVLAKTAYNRVGERLRRRLSMATDAKESPMTWKQRYTQFVQINNERLDVVESGTNLLRQVVKIFAPFIATGAMIKIAWEPNLFKCEAPEDSIRGQAEQGVRSIKDTLSIFLPKQPEVSVKDRDELHVKDKHVEEREDLRYSGLANLWMKVKFARETEKIPDGKTDLSGKIEEKLEPNKDKSPLKDIQTDEKEEITHSSLADPSAI